MAEDVVQNGPLPYHFFKPRVFDFKDLGNGTEESRKKLTTGGSFQDKPILSWCTSLFQHITIFLSIVVFHFISLSQLILY